MIELDPWVIRSDQDEKFTAEILATCDFNIPDHLNFNSFKKAEYLVSHIEGRENSVLLLQFETKMWAISTS